MEAGVGVITSRFIIFIVSYNKSSRNKQTELDREYRENGHDTTVQSKSYIKYQ